jgi:hypothetical protein
MHARSAAISGARIIQTMILNALAAMSLSSAEFVDAAVRFFLNFHLLKSWNKIAPRSSLATTKLRRAA